MFTSLFKRLLPVISWPTRFTGLCRSVELQKRILSDFKKDMAAFQELESLPAQSAESSILLKRSLFNLTAVQQYKEAFAELGMHDRDEPPMDLTELAKPNLPSLMTTTPCEEPIGTTPKTTK